MRAVLLMSLESVDFVVATQGKGGMVAPVAQSIRAPRTAERPCFLEALSASHPSGQVADSVFKYLAVTLDGGALLEVNGTSFLFADG